MNENNLEFEISGCLFTGNKKITIDELSNKFIDFIESKGWQFCGITKPLEE